MEGEHGRFQFRCRGHENIRGVHRKSIELTRAKEITQRATCILGVDADFDADALKRLRGRMRIELRVGELVDTFTAVASPFFQDAEGLVLRKSDQQQGRTFAFRSSKGALDLDRKLVAALADPAAELVVTIEPLGGDETSTGVLFVVSMPIGNEGDLSTRAARTLAAVDVIAAEDTRVTRSVLDRLGVRTPLVSYHDFNEAERAERIALVSDAGTPGCSDPGYRLVAEAVKAGIPVSPVPGPSAVLAALVGSGLAWDRFAFVGFLSRKRAARKAELLELAPLAMALVIYESPHRILETLEDLQELMPDRPLSVGRELTKAHEEFLRGTPAEVLEALTERDEVLGEFVVVIGPPPAEAPRESALSPELEPFVERLLAADVSIQTLSRALADQLGQGRKHWYQYLLERRQAKG